jgi:HD superfamily phosphohydrolase YqeK
VENNVRTPVIRRIEGKVRIVPHEMHPLVEAAGRSGALPDWTACRPDRRAHAARVAQLMGEWASDLGLDEGERVRWKAAGHLHDALKDAPTGELRSLVGPGWADTLLHGPACAERLREDGVRDEELLLAVACHSTGHPEFGALGEFLYLADYLEPGRSFLAAERAELRARLPAERREVLIAVMRERVAKLMSREIPLRLDSIRFWNRVTAQ